VLLAAQVDPCTVELIQRL
jgi:hypothetical protein